MLEERRQLRVGLVHVAKDFIELRRRLTKRVDRLVWGAGGTCARRYKAKLRFSKIRQQVR
jgi:hypothetical protein